jgi:hypothetical protein
MTIEFKNSTVISRLAEDTNIDRAIMTRLLEAHKTHARILGTPVKGMFVWNTMRLSWETPVPWR